MDSFKHSIGDMQGHLKIYEDFQGEVRSKNTRKGGMEPRSYRTEYTYLLYRWLLERWDDRYGDFWPLLKVL
jgi:hypothetical protein